MCGETDLGLRKLFAFLCAPYFFPFFLTRVGWATLKECIIWSWQIFVCHLASKTFASNICSFGIFRDISPSILMQKFDMILEYGGPSGISKVSTLSSEHIGARSLHFLEVGLDGPTKAFCEGITVALGDKSRIVSLLIYD